MRTAKLERPVLLRRILNPLRLPLTRAAPPPPIITICFPMPLRRPSTAALVDLNVPALTARHPQAARALVA